MNQELVDYIKQQISLSVSKNKITDVLLGQGWQQPELDEAFAAAEGAASAAAKVSYDSSEPAVEEGVASEGAPGGINRKMILIGAITLVILLGGGGVLMLTSSQGAKEQSPVAEKKTEIPVVTEPVEGGSSVTVDGEAKTGNDVGFGQEPAIDNTSLIKAAAILKETVTPPAGWVLREGFKNNLLSVGYFKPEAEKDSAGKVIFEEYLLVTLDNLKTANVANVGDYITKSKTALETGIKDFKVTAEKDVTLADGSAGKLIGCSYTDEGNAARCMQLIASKGDEVYVITAFVLASNWEAEKDMLGAAVMSFKFPAGN